MSELFYNAIAPTRVCDLGGWTDTWFAGHGAVFNIAVYPYVEVQIRMSERTTTKERVVISVENYDEAYALNPDDITYDKHPMIEAAIDLMTVPESCGLQINIYSEAPPGASMGTSAAVSVALVGARKPSEIKENIEAAGWVLDDEIKADIDRVFEEENVSTYRDFDQILIPPVLQHLLND